MILSVTLLLVLLASLTNGLRPIESESREILSLDGLWDFMAEKTPHEGTQEQWFNKRLAHIEGVQLMPVPSSYNDVTQNAELRDHVGVVWYQRCLILPLRFMDQSKRVVLHFGSVNYKANVWVNGEHVTQHEGGHLPFDVQITSTLARDQSQQACVTVSVNNTLTPRTIPQGRLFKPNATDDRYPPGYVVQKLEFDFVNYAGLHRSVILYTTPLSHIHGLRLVTSIKNAGTTITGVINYTLEIRDSILRSENFYYNLEVRDASGEEVLRKSFLRHMKGQLEIERPQLWWPHLSPHRKSNEPAHQYTMEIQLVPDDNEDDIDIYRTKFGIRSVEWSNTSLMINKEPFYFHGFGRHEDLEVRGRGLDVVLAWHDGYLLSWLGANSYRTSHYPYSEESLDVADHFGFVVIAETPAVGLNNFSRSLLKRHIAITRELVSRDRNRASVIMWSLANEPQSQLPEADSYFKLLSGNLSTFDPTRPITIVTSQKWNTDMAVQHVDVISVNRYPGWYGDGGRLELVTRQTENEVRRWHQKFSKPVLISEYGAGAIAGINQHPSSMWTEDYQAAIFNKHFIAFDALSKDGFFLGEMVWNFADFATPQAVIRPTGCMKGVVTRSRRPKHAAHILRRRYWHLALCRNQKMLPHTRSIQDLDFCNRNFKEDIYLHSGF